MIAITLLGTGSPMPSPDRSQTGGTSVGFRFDLAGSASVVTAGDTVRCPGLDRLCEGADVLVHTAIRKDLIEQVPDAVPEGPPRPPLVTGRGSSHCGTRRARDARAHPLRTADPDGRSGDDWRPRPTRHFDGRIEIGDDLHRVVVGSSAGLSGGE